MSYYNDVYDNIESAIRELAAFRLENALPVTTDAMRGDVHDYALDPANWGYKGGDWADIGEFLDTEGAAFIAWNPMCDVDYRELLIDADGLQAYILEYLFDRIYSESALEMLENAVSDIEAEQEEA